MEIRLCLPLLILLALALPLAPSRTEAAACNSDIYEKLRASADAQTRPVQIRCDLFLKPDDVITMPLAFIGSKASGVTLDCNGAVLDGSVARARTIVIGSRRDQQGGWSVPQGVTIRNCTIKGDIRIQGLGHNGEAQRVRQSSRQPGHTARAQAAAPRDILLSGLTFVAAGPVPLYAAPGVTGLTVETSRFRGSTAAPVIYLDAESARNRITGNVFEVKSGKREVIAVDGSANNRIDNNLFLDPITGGIFLYRNCGEGGTIRHQAPQRNVIAGNIFRYTDARVPSPAVWIGSRQGRRSYCLASGPASLDDARYNSVTGNRFVGGSPSLIIDHDRDNDVSRN